LQQIIQEEANAAARALTADGKLARNGRCARGESGAGANPMPAYRLRLASGRLEAFYVNAAMRRM